MKCPICDSLNTTVMDSRPEGNTRMRRLRCLDCGETFKTREFWENDPRYAKWREKHRSVKE